MSNSIVFVAEKCYHCGERPGDGCIFCKECIDEMIEEYGRTMKENTDANNNKDKT